MSNAPARNRVLVVDDNPAVREIFLRLLKASGFAVVVVDDGDDALRVLREDPTIGLVLLDLEMPGTDGMSVRRRQLADPDLAAIPTVIISGSGEARVNRSDLRAADYLYKPVQRQALVDVVSRYCRPVPNDTP